MIYLKNKNDVQIILSKEDAFQGKKKIAIETEKKIDLVIKGLTFEEAMDNEDILKNMGIDEIINLERKRQVEVNQQNLKFKTVGIKCKDKNAADVLYDEGIRLNHIKYKVENYIRPIHVIQCHKCNEFGHKKEYCENQSRCLICGENRESKECKSKSRKCSNCSGKHQANYKMCAIYRKEAEKKIEKNLINPTTKVSHARKDSFASVATPKDETFKNFIQEQAEQNKLANEKIIKMLEGIEKKLTSNDNKILALEVFHQEQILSNMDLTEKIDNVDEKVGVINERLILIENTVIATNNEIALACIDIHNVLDPTNKVTLDHVNKLLTNSKKRLQTSITETSNNKQEITTKQNIIPNSKIKPANNNGH